ncbi:MAG: hypothetical protein M1831_007268 [Alyxoria varia]|nr:MAG: hypothetical protein M1831_007268 [Alyxoria varia]
MATVDRVKLSPTKHRGIYSVPELTHKSADKASELLQRNHENYHVFFNDEHFHFADLFVELQGYYHPLIHLGFGIEFDQPLLIAEALGETAIHENTLLPLLKGVEHPRYSSNPASSGPENSQFAILEDIQKDSRLKSSVRFNDPFKFRAMFERALEEMVGHARRVQVGLSEKELKVERAEMMNFCAYFTAASAQHSTHAPRLDFYYLHSLNCGLFMPLFMVPRKTSTDPKGMFELPLATRARLLAWKSRVDLASYVSRAGWKLDHHGLASYVPRSDATDPWRDVFERICDVDNDDGHFAKVLRALAVGKRECDAYPEEAIKRGWKIHGNMWTKAAQMTMDSIDDAMETNSPKWITTTGFEEAWIAVPKL